MYEASDNLGVIARGTIDHETDDLDVVIDVAVGILGLSIRADQFARNPEIDGGVAIWSEDAE